MSTSPPPLPPRPPAGPRAPRGWWQRHWKWAVPLLALALLCMVLAFIALVVFGLRGAMQSSDVYVDALSRARAHPDVRAALGDPIEPGFMPSGSVTTSSAGGGSGQADLSVPLSGPRGSGALVATAERRGRIWIYDTLVFTPADVAASPVALVEPGTPVAAPTASRP